MGLLPPSKKNPCDPHTGATDSNAHEGEIANMEKNELLYAQSRFGTPIVQVVASGARCCTAPSNPPCRPRVQVPWQPTSRIASSPALPSLGRGRQPNRRPGGQTDVPPN